METKISRILLIAMVIAALYVAIQSIVWTIQANFPLTTILYVVAFMIVLLVVVVILAKQVW